MMSLSTNHVLCYIFTDKLANKKPVWGVGGVATSSPPSRPHPPAAQLARPGAVHAWREEKPCSIYTIGVKDLVCAVLTLLELYNMGCKILMPHPPLCCFLGNSGFRGDSRQHTLLLALPGWSGASIVLPSCRCLPAWRGPASGAGRGGLVGGSEVRACACPGLVPGACRGLLGQRGWSLPPAMRLGERRRPPCLASLSGGRGGGGG